MHKWFWFVLLAAFIVINENVVNWLLAMFVGGYSAGDGFARVTRFFTVDSLLFAAGFRAIPYLIVLMVALLPGMKKSLQGRVALWTALFSVTVIHFWGFWSMQHSLYTAEHTSSTSALALIFIPLHAVWIGAVTGTVMFVLVKLGRPLVKQ